MKSIWMLLPLFVLMNGSGVQAQEFKRFEFSVSSGLAVSGGIPLDAEGDTHYESIDVSSSYSVGGAFAVYLDEFDAIELYWQRQFTEGRLPAELASPSSPGTPATFNLNIDQYHMNFMHHYEIPIPKTRPYIMAGLGATTYYANSNGISDSLSYFSFSVGAGIKYYLNNHVGLRGEARWSPTVVSASDGTFWCQFGGSGAACTAKLSISLQQQMDLTGGLFFRF